MDEISAAFKAKVVVPEFPFTVSFFDDGTPQPVFVATCNSRADVNDAHDSIPEASSGHGEPPHDLPEAVLVAYADFKSKFEGVQTASKKSKNTAAKKKTASERSVQIQTWCRSLSNAQRYLGLRPSPTRRSSGDSLMSWEEQLAAISETGDTIPESLGVLDLNRPAPFPFAKLAIFISIDVESYERGHHLITEVGISTLDTLDLQGQEPGENGQNWRKHIRSRHFRIEEYTHLRNVDFCRGDPEAFQFGESEIVGLKDVGSVIDSCFEWPFSVQYKHDGKLKFETQTWDTQREAQGPNIAQNSAAGSPQPDLAELQQGPKQRNIFVVGHGLQGDLEYLAKVDSDIFATAAGLSKSAASYPAQNKINLDGLDARGLRGAKGLNSIKQAFDTASLYQVLKQDQNPRGLSSLLYDLDIRGFFLHNGGNDARYTLDALIAMIIKSRQIDDEKAAEQPVEAAAVMKAWDA
jgi:hypothetical protein